MKNEVLGCRQKLALHQAFARHSKHGRFHLKRTRIGKTANVFSQGICLHNIVSFFGTNFSFRFRSDATTAICMRRKLSVCKVRHLDTSPFGFNNTSGIGMFSLKMCLAPTILATRLQNMLSLQISKTISFASTYTSTNQEQSQHPNQLQQCDQTKRILGIFFHAARLASETPLHVQDNFVKKAAR